MTKFWMILPMVLLVACSSQVHCRIDDTRCNGAVAEVCGSDERWAEIMDCDEVATESGGRWACEAIEDGGHTCLPAADDADAGGAQ